jgi:hypothetical protein
MSAFTQAAALVKGAVLSTFGEPVAILDTNKTTVLANLQAHISTRVVEADEFQSVTTEVRMVKIDRAQSQHIRSGRYVRQKDGKVYKLTEPADPSQFAGNRSGTEHFVYWYLI